jgi:hypothetical protein
MYFTSYQQKNKHNKLTGYKMFLHKYFKVNGETKGIPTFMMFCNLYQKENTETDSSTTYQRFGWIKVVGRTNGIYVQL